MNYNVSPEKKGINSKRIAEYIDLLESKGLSTHSLIISRGDDVVFEGYWKPFDKEFLHRQYSVSKSIVSIAVGFAEQDGLLSLDDKVIKHFPEELKNQTDENMKNQTIRHMLMMSTAKLERGWFSGKPDDRVAFYFENDNKYSRPSGTIFQYDSTGSFVLGALVERLTGKPFIEYLREKFLDKIGVSKQMYSLKCPGGHSWGDSGVMAKPRDMLLIARFIMNGGKWNGEQILNEKYVREATSRQIDNNHLGVEEHNSFGYGYLIWRTYNNSYFFNGMGCQFAICVPDKDIIMIYNGDNQGITSAKETIIGNFFKIIVDNVDSEELCEENAKELNEKAENLTLMSAKGQSYSDFENEINGKKFILEPNPMGISEFTLNFDQKGGVFHYVNEQGEKELVFGRCENAYGIFPQEGYSDEVGNTPTRNNYYKCAVSGAWVEERKLYLSVQVIDKYFGRLNIVFGFLENGRVGLFMQKTAEGFLEEYRGYAGGKRE